MSFASLNGVNAAKGMQGTARTGTATFGGQAAAGPGGMAPAPPNYGDNGYTGGGGLDGAPIPGQGVKTFGRTPINPNLPQGSSYTKGAGMAMTGSSTQNQNSQGSANGNGVAPGVQIGSAVGPEQQMQFDASDPANAALAGYMADYKPGGPPAGPQPYQPPAIGAGAPGAGPAMANNTMGAGQGPAMAQAGPGAAQSAQGPQLQVQNRNLQRVM